MIGVGYMAKRVAERPEWLAAPQVTNIYSISNCVSRPFIADYIPLWRHNEYGLFDDPRTIVELAQEHQVSPGDLTLFYYEEHGQEFDRGLKQWLDLEPLQAQAVPAAAATLRGFDVATLSRSAGPECSPLSCNSLAATIPTNAHCLFDTLEQAKAAIDRGLFAASEPGTFGIYAVYTVLTVAWRA